MRSECIAHIIKEDWKNRIILCEKKQREAEYPAGL